MEQRNLKWRPPAETVEAYQLLATRYPQLLQWATGLARGDRSKAEEIVQEFCLYVTLVKPDLSEVGNLDGYLYTSLRHIYLSSLARASREALRVVRVEDFDSFALAMSCQPTADPVQRQNDLRRICTYAVWRKESSKSASYFTLHFFHGYGRQEIAELARLPISAIYNKLKVAPVRFSLTSMIPASYESWIGTLHLSRFCRGRCRRPRSFSKNYGKRSCRHVTPIAFLKKNCSRITRPPPQGRFHARYWRTS
jgi:DNA-directed RNA polymerase specialized sigma24 family protein